MLIIFKFVKRKNISNINVIADEVNTYLLLALPKPSKLPVEIGDGSLDTREWAGSLEGDVALELAREPPLLRGGSTSYSSHSSISAPVSAATTE